MTRLAIRVIKVAAALTAGVAATLAWSVICAWLIGGTRI